MNFFKSLIFFYTISLILIFLIFSLTGVKVYLLLTDWQFWILPMVFPLAGLWIGRIAYVRMGQPVELAKWVYTMCLVIGVAIFVIPIAWFRFSDRSKSLSPMNEFSLSSFDVDDREKLSIGLSLLKASSKPDSVYLVSASTVRKISADHADTLFQGNFVYRLSGMEDKKYFTRINVVDGIASFDKYNSNPLQNPDYLVVEDQQDPYYMEVRESLDSSLTEEQKEKIMDEIKAVVK